MEKYDIAVIGAGPAGYTSALYAGRAGYTSVVLEKYSPGGQMGITACIENYPGCPDVDGFTLTEKMMRQAKKFGTVMKSEEIISLDLSGDEKILSSKKNEYSARAVIVASGAKPRLLGVPGEREFTGRGVSYCASCDGMFYKGKTVAVNGGGDTAVEDALYLSNLCERVILIHRRNEFRASPHGVKKLTERENVTLVLDTVVESINGDDKVASLTVRNVKSNGISEIKCDGVFVAVGRIPDTEIYKGQLELDKNGYIVAGEDCRTSAPGVFAAGDVRTKALRQIVTACSDGANAVKSAEEWLTRQK